MRIPRRNSRNAVQTPLGESEPLAAVDAGPPTGADADSEPPRIDLSGARTVEPVLFKDSPPDPDAEPDPAALSRVEQARADLADVQPHPNLAADLSCAMVALWLQSEHRITESQALALVSTWAKGQPGDWPAPVVQMGVQAAYRRPAEVQQHIRQALAADVSALAPQVILPQVPAWFPAVCRKDAQALGAQHAEVAKAYGAITQARAALEAARDDRKSTARSIREAAHTVQEATIAALGAEADYAIDALAFCQKRSRFAAEQAEKQHAEAERLRAEIEEKVRASGAGLHFLPATVNGAPAVMEAEGRASQARALAQASDPQVAQLQDRLQAVTSELRTFTERLAGVR